MADLAALSFNFSLGLAAFFSPCGYPMLPAYLAYYLPRPDDRPAGLARSAGRGALGGLLAATGALLVLALVGALAVLLSDAFKARVYHLELVGGAIVLTLGVLTLLGRGPSFAVALRPSEKRSAFALVGFGALYAIVAAGCVAPLFVAAFLLAASAGSAIDTVLLVAAYGAGFALMLVGLTILVATAQGAFLRRTKQALPHIQRAGAVVMIAVGLYLVVYWAGLEFGFDVPTLPAPSF